MIGNISRASDVEITGTVAEDAIAASVCRGQDPRVYRSLEGLTLPGVIGQYLSFVIPEDFEAVLSLHNGVLVGSPTSHKGGSKQSVDPFALLCKDVPAKCTSYYDNDDPSTSNNAYAFRTLAKYWEYSTDKYFESITDKSYAGISFVGTAWQSDYTLINHWPRLYTRKVPRIDVKWYNELCTGSDQVCTRSFKNIWMGLFAAVPQPSGSGHAISTIFTHAQNRRRIGEQDFGDTTWSKAKTYYIAFHMSPAVFESRSTGINTEYGATFKLLMTSTEQPYPLNKQAYLAFIRGPANREWIDQYGDGLDGSPLGWLGCVSLQSMGREFMDLFSWDSRRRRRQIDTAPELAEKPTFRGAIRYIASRVVEEMSSSWNLPAGIGSVSIVPGPEADGAFTICMELDLLLSSENAALIHELKAAWDTSMKSSLSSSSIARDVLQLNSDVEIAFPESVLEKIALKAGLKTKVCGGVSWADGTRRLISQLLQFDALFDIDVDNIDLPVPGLAAPLVLSAHFAAAVSTAASETNPIDVADALTIGFRAAVNPDVDLSLEGTLVASGDLEVFDTKLSLAGELNVKCSDLIRPFNSTVFRADVIITDDVKGILQEAAGKLSSLGDELDKVIDDLPIPTGGLPAGDDTDPDPRGFLNSLAGGGFDANTWLRTHHRDMGSLTSEKFGGEIAIHSSYLINGVFTLLDVVVVGGDTQLPFGDAEVSAVLKRNQSHCTIVFFELNTTTAASVVDELKDVPDSPAIEMSWGGQQVLGRFGTHYKSKIKQALTAKLAEATAPSCDSFSFAGHGLGGAYAMLAAFDFASTGTNVLDLYTFGAPTLFASDAVCDDVVAGLDAAITRSIRRFVYGFGFQDVNVFDPVASLPTAGRHCLPGHALMRLSGRFDNMVNPAVPEAPADVWFRVGVHDPVVDPVVGFHPRAHSIEVYKALVVLVSDSEAMDVATTHSWIYPQWSSYFNWMPPLKFYLSGDSATGAFPGASCPPTSSSSTIGLQGCARMTPLAYFLRGHAARNLGQKKIPGLDAGGEDAGPDDANTLVLNFGVHADTDFSFKVDASTLVPEDVDWLSLEFDTKIEMKVRADFDVEVMIDFTKFSSPTYKVRIPNMTIGARSIVHQLEASVLLEVVSASLEDAHGQIDLALGIEWNGGKWFSPADVSDLGSIVKLVHTGSINFHCPLLVQVAGVPLAAPAEGGGGQFLLPTILLADDDIFDNKKANFTVSNLESLRDFRNFGPESLALMLEGLKSFFNQHKSHPTMQLKVPLVDKTVGELTDATTALADTLLDNMEQPIPPNERSDGDLQLQVVGLPFDASRYDLYRAPNMALHMVKCANDTEDGEAGYIDYDVMTIRVAKGTSSASTYSLDVSSVLTMLATEAAHPTASPTGSPSASPNSLSNPPVAAGNTGPMHLPDLLSKTVNKLNQLLADQSLYVSEDDFELKFGGCFTTQCEQVEKPDCIDPEDYKLEDSKDIDYPEYYKAIREANACSALTLTTGKELFADVLEVEYENIMESSAGWIDQIAESCGDEQVRDKTGSLGFIPTATAAVATRNVFTDIGSFAQYVIAMLEMGTGVDIPIEVEWVKNDHTMCVVAERSASRVAHRWAEPMVLAPVDCMHGSSVSGLWLRLPRLEATPSIPELKLNLSNQLDPLKIEGELELKVEASVSVGEIVEGDDARDGKGPAIGAIFGSSMKRAAVLIGRFDQTGRDSCPNDVQDRCIYCNGHSRRRNRARARVRRGNNQVFHGSRRAGGSLADVFAAVPPIVWDEAVESQSQHIPPDLTDFLHPLRAEEHAKIVLEDTDHHLSLTTNTSNAQQPAQRRRSRRSVSSAIESGSCRLWSDEPLFFPNEDFLVYLCLIDQIGSMPKESGVFNPLASFWARHAYGSIPSGRPGHSWNTCADQMPGIDGVLNFTSTVNPSTGVSTIRAVLGLAGTARSGAVDPKEINPDFATGSYSHRERLPNTLLQDYFHLIREESDGSSAVFISWQQYTIETCTTVSANVKYAVTSTKQARFCVKTTRSEGIEWHALEGDADCVWNHEIDLTSVHPLKDEPLNPITLKGCSATTYQIPRDINFKLVFDRRTIYEARIDSGLPNLEEQYKDALAKVL